MLGNAIDSRYITTIYSTSHNVAHRATITLVKLRSRLLEIRWEHVLLDIVMDFGGKPLLGIIGRRNTLMWRHNGHGDVWNLQPHDCLLNRSFRRRSKKTSKLRVTGLCEGNSPVTGEFPAQRGSKRGKCFHLMTSWSAGILFSNPTPDLIEISSKSTPV